MPDEIHEENITFIELFGRKIAMINSRHSTKQGIFWLGGFASEMNGTKANFLAQWAQQQQISFLRFDYSGCGLSGGDFYQGRVSHWHKEAEAIFEQHAKGKQLVIASSMGAWIALLLAQKFREQIAALILIAPAPDFTEKLIGRKLRAKVMHLGRLPFDHSAGPLSRVLLEDGATQLVMRDKIKLSCPVHILLGLNDDVVPLNHVLKLVELMDAPDVQLTCIKNGDHSLSEPSHLAQLQALAAKFYQAL